MSLVVADTGPLRYLVVIQAIECLPTLFARVIVPPAVVSELTHPRAPVAARQWAQGLPSWLEVQRPNRAHQADLLDPGEAEAIGLALQLQAMVLLDEREARREAVQLGLSVMGTVGILERAAERGLLDLEAAFARLTATNYRIDRGYLDEALQRSRQRPRPLNP